MNQTCKVCGEPAAGFHFGAFTCEGCKSFFGRSYNNLNSITECKNNGECIINKKNRTACKACRLRKCLLVGMSKSGSRYGRRSNWFKIHCLLQEQQQQSQSQLTSKVAPTMKAPHQKSPMHQHQIGMSLLGQHFSSMHLPKTKEELMLLGLEDYKNSASPAVSSPESHNSDNSVEVSDARRIPLFQNLLPPTFLPPPGLFFPAAYPPLHPGLLAPANNNNRLIRNHNSGVEAFSKRVFLDVVLQSQRSPSPEREIPPHSASPVQDDPIDLSMKPASERGSSPAHSEHSDSVVTERGAGSEADEESECDSENGVKRLLRTTPLDLTTKV